jgi:[protein-PII] uridylyltransferase
MDEQQKAQPRKNRLFSIPSRVMVDNEASHSSTLVEINAKDRPGLLFDIASAFSESGLQISAAKVTTFGSRAVDVFYVRDAFGLKILHPDRLADIRKAVYLALENKL